MVSERTVCYCRTKRSQCRSLQLQRWPVSVGGEGVLSIYNYRDTLHTQAALMQQDRPNKISTVIYTGHLSYTILTLFVAPNATFVCFTTPEIRTPL